MKPIDSCLPRFNSVNHSKTPSVRKSGQRNMSEIMSMLSDNDNYAESKNEQIKNLFVEKGTIGERGIKRF
jgi:hypothetical protein